MNQRCERALAARIFFMCRNSCIMRVNKAEKERCQNGKAGECDDNTTDGAQRLYIVEIDHAGGGDPCVGQGIRVYQRRFV